MRLKDKVAIITGSSRGIGFAIAEEFIKQGAKVVVCGSRIETAQKGEKALKEKYPNAETFAQAVNVLDSDDIQKMAQATVDKWGRIDILVNNAGVTSNQSILEMTDKDFEDVININLTAPFKCCREVTRFMKDTGGSIINTSSMVGTYGGRNQCAYASSKFGVNGLTKSLAKELGHFNIRVNAVAPGVVGTDMVAESVSPQLLEMLKRATPLERMAQPSELAGIYVYLASDEASFTTGAIFHVDGGILM